MDEKKSQKKWEREEVVILVVEYFRTKNLSNKEIVDTQKRISEFLRKREIIISNQPISDVFRDYAGIHMQTGRIRCLDPDNTYSGMQATKLQKEVVKEYLKNPKALIAEAEYIYEKYNEIDSTVSYYDDHAEEYFRSTVNIDFSNTCDKFLSFLNPGDKIIDLGAGSGRDLAYFMNKGFEVDGIDASSEMCRLATLYLGKDIICQRIQDWNPKEKYNGIWANASLLHISQDEVECFLTKVDQFLTRNGILYLSVKEGIPTGLDAFGRHYTGFTLDQICNLVLKNNKLKIIECWVTEDKLNRYDVKWINIIAQKCK